MCKEIETKGQFMKAVTIEEKVIYGMPVRTTNANKKWGQILS